MTMLHHITRRASVSLALVALAGCAQGGSLGSVLGSVLGGQQGGQQGGQLTGSIQRVDTRSQQISVQQSNGQTVVLNYDNQTKVVYQNQNYSVSSLENGDQVTARVQSSSNGAYYTDLVQVDQSVQNTNGGTTSGQVQSLQGTVRSVNTANGWFTLDASSSVTLTVTMPYNASRTDVQRFQNLRNGDVVRFGGVFVNNTRVELRQFY